MWEGRGRSESGRGRSGLLGRRASLAAAAVAFMAAQGFGRFGFALILPSMQDGLGLSSGEMGSIAGIGLAAYVAFSIPAGALAARFGTRWVVVGGLIATAAGLAGTGLAGDLPTAAAAQALVGAGAPAVIVPVLAIGGAWFAPRFRGRATGLVVAGGGLGILTAGLLVPLLLGPDARDWRRAWWGLAVAVLAAAAVTALALRDPPNGGAGRPRPSLGRVYRSAAVWQLGVLFGLYGVAYIIYGTFFAAHLAQRGLDAGTAARLWSLAGITAIGSGLLGGVLADRLGPAPALALMFVTQGMGLALLALGDGYAWYVGSAVLYGASLWGFPSAISKACAEVVGSELAPAAIGLSALFFGGGQAIAPVASGLLADWSSSLAAALLLGAGADLAGLVGALLLRLRAPAPVT